MDETIGQRIKRLREARDMSQRALARAIGRSSPSVWSIEHDLQGTIQLDTIQAMADVLGTNIIYLTTGEGDDKPWGAAANEIMKMVAKMPAQKQDMILQMIRAVDK